MNDPIIGRELMDRVIDYLRIGEVKIRSMYIDAPLNDASLVTVELVVTQELLEALCKSN